MRLPRGEFSLRSSVQSPFPFETQSLYCFFAGLTSFDVTQSEGCCQSSILYTTFIFKSTRRRMKGKKNHLGDRTNRHTFQLRLNPTTSATFSSSARPTRATTATTLLRILLIHLRFLGALGMRRPARGCRGAGATLDACVTALLSSTAAAGLVARFDAIIDVPW